MTIEGTKFFIPTKEREILLVSNFNRSNEQINEGDGVSLYELNKSDYLFETIILFIVRKIKNSNIEESIKLYRLIDNINDLRTKIFLKELRYLDIVFEDVNYQDPAEESINSLSKRLAQECIDERIFDYD